MSKLELFKQNLASENMDVLTGTASAAIKGGKKSGKKSYKKSKKYNSSTPPPVYCCPPPPCACGPGSYGNPHYYRPSC